MKTYIICKAGPTTIQKIVWFGDIGCQFTPRIGESIIVEVGGNPEPIKDIVYGPGFSYCKVYIPYDYDNLYKEKLPLFSAY
jgi:hypothetical protein